MAIVARERKHGTRLYVTNRVDGIQVAEPVESGDAREAQRADRRMKRQIADGTYARRTTAAVTVGSFAKTWFVTRTHRNAEKDEELWRNHVVARCPWFLTLKLEDVRRSHVLRLVTELGQSYINHKGVPFTLASKSVALIFGVGKTMFQFAALEHEDTMTRGNPFLDLPKGTIDPSPTEERIPYTAEEVRTLTRHALIGEDARMFIKLLFYTGMREGEVCGRRWRDWDRNCTPLTGLDVKTQYNDQPLKTTKAKRKQGSAAQAPRVVPVHPELARALEWWWAHGFELVYCRKPTLGDFIVPGRCRDGRNHSASSGYKMFLRACKAAGVAPHTLHSTRHTFITLTRRGTARFDVVEWITHNSKGKMIDRYNHFEWDLCCEVVSGFLRDAPPPAVAKSNVLPLPARKAG